MKRKSICLVKGCVRVVHAKELCHKHYQQLRKRGGLTRITRYDDNDIILEGDIAYVILQDIKGKARARAIIDVDDIPKIKRYRWRFMKARETGYAATGNGRNTVLMHRLINNTPKGAFTDHTNFDKLDNRKANLRTCTSFQNMHHRKELRTNNSGFKGVHFHKATSKWAAEIIANTNKERLGLFDTKIEAAQAYNRAAIRLHGEFAHLNKI